MRRIAARILAWLLTEELAEAIEGDLEEEYRRRARGGRLARVKARLWVGWQLLTLPYLRLGRRARRLEARERAARRGGRGPTRERLTGEEEGTMGMIVRDLVTGVRTLVRRPGFTLLAAGTLALGVGAHAALFSVVDQVLLDPVDLPRSEELVVVRMRSEGELRPLTGPNAVDLIREGDEIFAGAGAFWGTSATIESADGRRESRPGVGATAGIFDALAFPFQLGGPWGPEAVGTGALRAVVITDRYWRSQFGADSTLVGSTLLLSGSPAEVTGVLSPGFAFPTLEDADFIFASPTDPAGVSRAGLGAFTLLARLGGGATVERAREEVAALWEGLRSRHPGDLLENDVAVMGLQDYVVRDVRPALLALLGATSLLLLLACANVANLMLVRGLGRGTEMSIRASLGAGRGRLAGQLLVESAILAGVAGLAGVFFAEGALAVLRAVAPPEIPGIADVELSVRATGFAFALAAGCAVLVGLVPALRVSKVDLGGALRTTRSTGGRRVRRLQGALVVAQVTAAVVLAVGAGLLARSFHALSEVDPGYRTEGVLTMGVGVPADLYPTRASRAAFFRRLEAELDALPGVLRVGTTFRAPFSSGELSVPVRLADRETMTLEDAPRVEVGIISAGYLEALEIPVLRGRSFTAEDRGESPRVALLSASLARRLYGDENPVGRRLTPVLGPWEAATNWADVVGVVGDIRLEGLDAEAVGTLYLAMPQLAQPYGTVAIRTAGDPAALADAARQTALALEPKVVPPTLRTLASLRSESLARPRFNSLLLGAFSLLALTLAAVGVYGLMAYLVAARRLELGVRVAFGAGRRSVVGLVVGQGMRLTGVGLLLGLAGALVASRALSGLLFRIDPMDPVTYAGTLAGVAAVALAGCLLPALRAARSDPREALNAE